MSDSVMHRSWRPTPLISGSAALHLAAIAGTVVVNFAYLMPQMAGAGVLVRLLTGISYDWAVIFVGVSMNDYQHLLEQAVGHGHGDLFGSCGDGSESGARPSPGD